MKYVDNKVEGVKIAYIGGGSRGWAWGLMSDLVSCDDMSGDVYLYDIDQEASKANEIIGNKFNSADGAKTVWNYHAVENIGDALTGADFVVISILPGTFDEMEVDVHAPEKYGIYQPVGDSTGPGGIVRAMRTVPMFEEIAENIKKYSPNAWVINYTNPMTMCVKTLYKVFPKIKAWGCCHEVFSTENLLATICKEKFGVEVSREDIKVNVLGINHFTWVNKAYYKTEDLFPLLDEFIEKNPNGTEYPHKNWANSAFKCTNQVKFDLYKRFGVLAAAGDRHLAEFYPGEWYLKNPETIDKFGFKITTVDWRREELAFRMEATNDLLKGKKLDLVWSGEESVEQMKAVLGFGDFVTNVNIPNIGQAPDLPLGAVVETNAYFSSSSVRPVFAGNIPKGVYELVSKVVEEQEKVVDSALNGDYESVFNVFKNSNNVNIPEKKARELFNKMLINTKDYLPKEAFDKYMKTQKV